MLSLMAMRDIFLIPVEPDIPMSPTSHLHGSKGDAKDITHPPRQRKAIGKSRAGEANEKTSEQEKVIVEAETTMVELEESTIDKTEPVEESKEIFFITLDFALKNE